MRERNLFMQIKHQRFLCCTNNRLLPVTEQYFDEIYNTKIIIALHLVRLNSTYEKDCPSPCIRFILVSNLDLGRSYTNGLSYVKAILVFVIDDQYMHFFKTKFRR